MRYGSPNAMSYVWARLGAPSLGNPQSSIRGAEEMEKQWANCPQIVTDRRERADRGPYAALQIQRTPDPTVWAGIRESALARRVGRHALYAMSEGGCAHPDTNGRREPRTGGGGTYGQAQGVKGRKRKAYSSIPRRV
jgi:hypothetical protein